MRGSGVTLIAAVLFHEALVIARATCDVIREQDDKAKLAKYQA